MADITNLRQAFVDEIRDIYHAEKQLLKALPKLARAASDIELRGALENHLAETENQVSRLELRYGDDAAEVQERAGRRRDRQAVQMRGLQRPTGAP